MHTIDTPLKSCFAAVTLSLSLLGCATTDLKPSNIGPESKPTTNQFFSGTPLPPWAVVKQDKSFIMGGADHWFGRITLNVGRDSDIAYRYFVQNYPLNGWTLVSSVRTTRSLLIFTKGDLSLTIEITEANYLMPGEAVLTASPLAKQQPMGNLGGGTNITPLR